MANDKTATGATDKPTALQKLRLASDALKDSRAAFAALYAEDAERVWVLQSLIHLADAIARCQQADDSYVNGEAQAGPKADRMLAR